jgi:hypothetical protein
VHWPGISSGLEIPCHLKTASHHDGAAIQHHSFPPESHARPDLPSGWHLGGVRLEISLLGIEEGAASIAQETGQRLWEIGDTVDVLGA